MKLLKSFGQHFLQDQQIIENILAACDVKSDATVVEIGPGSGNLTRHLILKYPHLHVIEADKRWCEYLEKKYAESLKIHYQDALKFDWSQVPNQLFIVGNLPYQIASELMVQLVATPVNFKSAVLMMQLEEAERAMALVNTKAYGRLSVLLQTQLDFEVIVNVPPEAFKPPPKVQSQVIKLTPKPQPLCPPSQLHYLSLVSQTAFSKRRKKNSNAFEALFSLDALKSCGIDPHQRPQEVSIAGYLELAKILEKRGE